MRVLQCSETKLTLQYRPFRELASSLLISGIAIAILFVSHSALSIQFLLGFMMLVSGASLLFLTDWVTSTVDLPSQTISIRRKGIVSRVRQMRCQLNQVQGVKIHSSLGRVGYEYRLCLLLHSGKSVALMSSKSIREDNIREMAHKLGRFTDKPVSENDFGAWGFGYFKEQFSEVFELHDQRLPMLFLVVTVVICGVLAGMLR